MPSSWKWGYGWRSPLLLQRDYQKVTDLESQWLQEKLEDYDCDQEIKNFATTITAIISQDKVDSICKDFKNAVNAFVQ